jgi:NAD(P)-dependent dehydrogenase (short-subunit alcohol dehydrogenase family)
MGQLTGKVAIITGGGQGVGLGIAAAFARAGASLMLSGRDVAKLERAAGSLELAGGTVAVIAADVTMRADADKTIAATIERFGQIDILVNNAQSSIPGVRLVDIDDDVIAMTLGSGLLGTIYHMQAAYPHLKGRGGSVINMGSREGLHGGKGFGIYAATKEAIRGWSRVAAREWGADKIRVNTLCPGALSPASAEYLDANPEIKRGYLAEIALGHFGDAEDDVGPVALFLACDDSRFVTGQTLCADGGLDML